MEEAWPVAQEPLRAPSPGLRLLGAAQSRSLVQGARAAAGAAQPDWPGRCERGLQRPAPGVAGASGLTTRRPAPPRLSPSLPAASAAPRPARRAWPGATEAPPPPRLYRRRSPRGTRPGSGGCRPGWLGAFCPGRTKGHQTPASAAGSGLRQGGETQNKKEKKNRTRAEGEKLYFFSHSFLELKGRAGYCASAGSRERTRHDPSPLRAEELGPGVPQGRRACGTPRTLSATGRPSSRGRRRQSCGWTQCSTCSGSWSAAN